MKKIIVNLVFLLLTITLGYNKGTANWWEFGMKVTSNGTTLISGVPIYLYRIDDVSYGFLTSFRYCVSADGTTGVNFRCDIDDNDEPSQASWEWIPSGDYYLRVGNTYLELSIPQADPNADFELLYNAQTGNITITADNRGISLGSKMTWSFSEVSVLIDQQLQNSTTTGTIKRWAGYFTPLPQLNTSYKFSNSSTQVLQGDQSIQSSQKYNYWSNSGVTQNDVTNHHSFLISPQTSSLVSHFVPIYSGITIQDYLMDAGTNPSNTSVSFSDPWLIDSPDNDHGGVLRNQGASAPFKSRTSPFTPDLTTSFGGDTYKGVFFESGI